MGEIMTDLQAIEIIESENPQGVSDELKAWQHLINTGLVWKLQGSYGRTARALIDEGILNDPNG
jgi:hypothetical protein